MLFIVDHCFLLFVFTFGHCIACPFAYGFRSPLWYLLVIVLPVLSFTASDHLCGICWSLYCVSFHLRLLITSVVSVGHCIACPFIYGFRSPLWYLLVIVLPVLSFTASDYPCGICWSLYYLSFHLRLPITSVVSFGHCIACPFIYGFWLPLSLYLIWSLYCITCPFIYGFRSPLWYLLVIVLRVLSFTASDYLCGICGHCICPFIWSLSLYCLSLSFIGHCITCPFIYAFRSSVVSFGHCIACPFIYGFWLPLWYLLVIVLRVLSFTASDYLCGIFWSLYCVSFHLRLPITSVVSVGHCIACPFIYGFRSPLWYLLVIVLPVLSFTASDHLCGICWSLYYLSFHLRLPITSVVSAGHCIACPFIYGFWLPLWYLLVIVLPVLSFTASDHLCGICWSLYCLSFHLRLLITPVVSVGHCITCPFIYAFRSTLWYLLVIVLPVLSFTASDYLCGIFWSLYCVSFHLRLLITSVVSFGHCIACPFIYASDHLCGIFWSLYCLSFHLRLLITSVVSVGHCIACPFIYGFWLPLWYLLVIVLRVLSFTASDYLCGICWSLYCLSFHLRLLITSVVSVGHCIACPFIYGFRSPLWYLLLIVLPVLSFTTSDYLCGICWSLYCVSFHLRLLITSVVSFGHCIACPFIYGFRSPLWYLLVIVLPVLSFTLLITSVVSVGHCIACPFIYGFWLPLWYLLVIVLPVLSFTASVYLCGICWSLYCLSFHLPLPITSVVSAGHCIACPFIYDFWLPLWYLLVIVLRVLSFTASDHLCGICWSLYCVSFHLRLPITSVVSAGHCIACPFIYDFWLPLWYLLVIVLPVLSFTASDHLCGICWSLYCVSFHLRLPITSVVSVGHCIACPFIYGFRSPLWYLLVIVLPVLSFTASDHLCGICWSLYCLSFHLRLPITSVVSAGHCIACPFICGFWLPLWYLLVIALRVLSFTASDYLCGIFWSLYCLSFHLRLLITSVISFGHCIACPFIYGFRSPLVVSFGHCITCPFICGFWLPLWYLLVIVLRVLSFAASDYLCGICWSLYCVSFHLRLLITFVVSFGHCIACPFIYGFRSPLWYLLVIVLPVLSFTTSDYLCGIVWSLYCLSFHFTASDYLCGIFWLLYCLSFHLRLLITSVVSFGDCIACPFIYGFWLPLWYLLVIALPVLSFYDFWLPLWYLFVIVLPVLSFTTSDYLVVFFCHCIACPFIYGFWLPMWYLLVIILPVLSFTASDYLCGIFWSLYCLSFHLRLLITSVVSFGHCIACPFIYGFWLPLWYLLVIVLPVLSFTASDYPCGIFWSLYCLSFHLRLLITSVVSFGHCIACPFLYGFWLPLWSLHTFLFVSRVTSSEHTSSVGFFWYWMWTFDYKPNTCTNALGLLPDTHCKCSCFLRLIFSETVNFSLGCLCQLGVRYICLFYFEK